ncbi:hypothetical protein Hypma_000349 [Hypsizygus marmoreus]|uniref:F-box domain-containing protein n=1 Tax=Hypsizygus marmoreus TaxID=39966 RepID=A0A369JHX6_HYPMA|nr:hypothetical protein Hypma_000349 [Hypsizygus marmoreus]
MATKSLSLAALDRDVLHTIFDEVNYMLRFDQGIIAVRLGLLPLSGTCKRLREIIAPSIFRRVRNLTRYIYQGDHIPGNDYWPPSIWKYIEIVYIYGRSAREIETFEVFAPIIPQLPYLKQVHFQIDATPPEVLLRATAAAGISSLEFTHVRLDGPPLTDIFSRLKLTHLLLTVSGWRPRDLNAPEELKYVAHILPMLSTTLTYLKISGDLLGFETLARLDWPCLSTLTLIDRIPDGQHMPLPTVISHMPRLRNLHYNFSATSEKRIPPIIYWPDSLGAPSLSVTHPQLVSLSMSNIHPTEHALDKLPESLRSLRILALRERGQQSLEGPWYPFSPLRETDALQIIAKAALLPDLIDLSLTLVDLPSPTVIEAIAKSCPGLQFLEISQGDYEHNHTESPYLLESLAKSLAQMRHLRELRISVGFGPQYIGSRFRGLLDKTPLYDRMDTAANIFAQRLENLSVLSFSFANDGDYGGLEGHVIWYRYGIVSGVDGRPPVAKWDLAFPYEVSSEPDSRICGFA